MASRNKGCFLRLQVRGGGGGGSRRGDGIITPHPLPSIEVRGRRPQRGERATCNAEKPRVLFCSTFSLDSEIYNFYWTSSFLSETFCSGAMVI